MQSHFLFLYERLEYVKDFIIYLRVDRIKKAPENNYWVMLWFSSLFFGGPFYCWLCYNPWLREKANFLGYKPNSKIQLLMVSDFFIPEKPIKKKTNPLCIYIFVVADQLWGDYIY